MMSDDLSTIDGGRVKDCMVKVVQLANTYNFNHDEFYTVCTNLLASYCVDCSSGDLDNDDIDHITRDVRACIEGCLREYKGGGGIRVEAMQ
jgi:hypothetical protein